MSTGLLALAAHTNAKADLSFKAFLYRELIQETLGFGTLLPCYMPVNINLCILRHAGPLRRAAEPSEGWHSPSRALAAQRSLSE